MWTAVILEDYIALAENIPGIISARALDWHTDPDIVTRPYLINIYVVPSGGQGISTELRESLESYFDERKTVDKVIAIYEAEYLSIDVEVVVYP